MESLRVLMIHLLLLELGVADVARGDGLLGWLWWRKPLCSNNLAQLLALPLVTGEVISSNLGPTSQHY
jgi:hypothetical protein